MGRPRQGGRGRSRVQARRRRAQSVPAVAEAVRAPALRRQCAASANKMCCDCGCGCGCNWPPAFFIRWSGAGRAHLRLAVVAVDVGEVRDDRLRVARVGEVALVDRLLVGGRRILKQLAERVAARLGGGVRLRVGLAGEALRCAEGCGGRGSGVQAERTRAGGSKFNRASSGRSGAAHYAAQRVGGGGDAHLAAGAVAGRGLVVGDVGERSARAGRASRAIVAVGHGV